MKKRLVLILAIAMLFILPSFSVMSNDVDSTDSKVILIQTSKLSDASIIDYTSLAKAAEKPIVVFTSLPVERQSEYEQAYMTTDLETHETTEESVTILKETEYVSEFTVITPDGNMKSYCYISDREDNPDFADALINQVEELKMVSPTQWRESIVAVYNGDTSAYDYHNQWQKTLYKLISAVNDGDSWTLETTYSFDIYRSKPDIYTLKRVWMIDWYVSSLIDSGDYSTDIWGKWCGPWVTQRYISDSPKTYGAANEELWDWGPTTSVGSWTYQISAGIQVSDTVSVSMGIQKQWTKSDVTITDSSSQGSDYTIWTETFIGPDYAWWPVSYVPCDASHNTFLSYRGSEWRFASSDTTYDTTQYVKTTISYDDGFYWVVFPLVIGYYRYTYYVSYTNPTHSYG